MIGTGLCRCGCGERTTVAAFTDRKNGRVKGQPMAYLPSHNKRRAIAYAVDVDTGCWIWLGSTWKGYGRINVGGTPRPAHRVHWEAINGPVPDGYELDHLCRNRTCVNPAHLEAVTHGENTRRGARAKLTWTAVGIIRSSALSARALAARFEVSPATVYSVRGRKSSWPEP